MAKVVFNTYFHFPIGFKHYHWFFLKIGIILNSSLLFGQVTSELNTNKSVKHQISFRHDNDFLTFTDRYYSSGLFLEFGKRLDHGFFKSGQEQLVFSLSQEIYTPSNTKTRNIVEMDRPYAGFFGLTFGWSFAKHNTGWDANVLVGIAGKSSGAGDFHRWYHKALEVPNPPTWAYEIANSFHLNIYAKFIHEWQLVNGDFGVHLGLQSKFAFGTKDIYAQPELITYFGKRNTMSYSSAYKKIGSIDRELFFVLRAGYRFVVYNAMLEGNIFGDNSTFVVNPKNTVFCAGFDLQHHNYHNDYWLGYRFNSKETAKTKMHKYIILSYARSF